jgi:hypothetical protein
MSSPDPTPASPQQPVTTTPTGAAALPAAPLTSAEPEEGQEGGRRRLYIAAGIGIAVLIGLVIVLLPFFRISRGQEERKGKAPEDLLTQARQSLARDTDVNTCRTALQQINSHLLKKPDMRPPGWQPGQREETQRLLGLPDADLSEADSSTYTTLDGQHLDTCYLFRDAVRSLEPRGIPDEDAPQPLDRVAGAFGWAVREVRLQPHANYTTPPSFAVRRSWGTELERALVFLEMLRQIHESRQLPVGDPRKIAQGEITGCLVFLPEDAEGKQERLWACGVLIKDDPNLYLFDPRLGLPLPGPDGRVATLADACTDGPDNPLRRLDLVPGSQKKEERYDVTAEDARKAVLRQVASLSAVSPRMRHLQDVVLKPRKPEERVQLAVDVVQQRQRLNQAGEAAKAKGWKGKVEAWQDVEAGTQPVKLVPGATLLRRFLPPEEGGTDTVHQFPVGFGFSLPATWRQWFEFEMVPWGALPSQFRDYLQFPPNIGLGQRVRFRFANYWIAPALEPGKQRDLMLRGRYAKAVPELNNESTLLEDRLEREKNERAAALAKGKDAAGNQITLESLVYDWVNDKAKPAYANLLRAEQAGNQEEVTAATAQVEAVWNEGIPVRVLLDGAVAKARQPDLAYWQGLCMQEQAELAQIQADLLEARLLRLGANAHEKDRQAAEKARKAAQKAWRDARGVWISYLANYNATPARPVPDRPGARRMLARAILLYNDPSSPITPAARRAAALAQLEDQSDGATAFDKIASAYAAREVRRWWLGKV